MSSVARLVRIIKLVLFSIVGVAVGLFGLVLFFSDFAPSETVLSRGLTIFFLFLVSGLVIGYLIPEAWPISGLMAWGAVLVGAVALLGGGGTWLQAVGLLLAPLAFAIGSGYLGAWLRRKRILQRLIGRR